MSVTPKASMKRRSAAAVVTLSGIALFACSDQTPLDPPSVAPEFTASPYANGLATTGWQEQARLLVAANRFSPLAGARVYALLAVAQYDAINTVDNQGYSDGILPDQGYGPGGRSRFESERGAVAGASAVVLSYLFPSAKDALDLRVQQEAQVGSGQSHPHFDHGLRVGVQTGENMVERARNDHSSDPWTGTVPDGMWRNNGPPINPMLGLATPYFLSSGKQFRPAPPPAVGSPAFEIDLDEIRMLSATRTAEQLATAQFWNFAAGTATSSGYWNQLASGYIEQYRLDERAAAHVFALMHAASYDAGIGCWDAKYFYWLIRPSQVDAAITLPIGLPNHPSYPSGHSCNSAAATTVLAHFFPAHATDLAGQKVAAGLSRMYAGIHYRFDITAGEAIGTSVAQLAIALDESKGMLSAIR